MRSVLEPSSSAFGAFRLRAAQATEQLSELARLAEGIGAATLAARIRSQLVHKIETERFHLVVLGEFNRGKSTFINALLGAPLLATGVTPTTAVIHRIGWADAPCATVVTTSGERTPLDPDQLRRGSVGDTADAGAVAHVDIGYQSPLLRDRVVLVDTPGVNDLSLQRADITYGYIPQSDAVLFLLDAGQPLTESERQFLEQKLLLTTKDADATASGRTARDKIVFVVTKADIWSDGERDEALTYLSRELAKLVGSPILFPISAHLHLAGDVDGGGLPPLLEHLTRFLAQQRGRILLDNALGDGLEAAKVLRRGVDARRRAIAMSSEELGRRIDQLERDLTGRSKTADERRTSIRQEVAAIRAWSRRDVDRFADDVCRQLPETLAYAEASDIRTHLASFLERVFAEWASAETTEIADALEQLAERTVVLVREDALHVAAELSARLGGQVQAPDVRIDTFAYDVGVFALFTVGLGVMFSNLALGGMLTIAAPVLAAYVKERVEVQTRKRAVETAETAVRQACAKMGPRLEEMIDEFAGKLDAWVVTTGEELHREVIEVLARARADHDAATPDHASGAAEIDRTDAALSAAIDGLESARADLWSEAVAEDEALAALLPPTGIPA